MQGINFDSMPRILEVDPSRPDPATMAEAGAIIRAGGLVIFPTETVYGLGANALDPDAVARIYTAKGRPGYNPLIVHVPAADAARDVVSEWPARAAALANAFWPGPLTLVLPRASTIPDVVTAGLPTVGVRVPSHPVAGALLRAAGRPIAAPSANEFMALSPTTAAHLSDLLLDRVDMVLDAGPSSVGIESTVVDLTTLETTILRPGVISATDLEQVVGDVRAADTPSDDAPRRSPGMLDRHYAPRAALLVIDGARIAAEVDARLRRGESIAVMTWSPGPATASEAAARLPEDAREYARLLYATLHEFDEAGVSVIVVERVPDGPEWDGIRDRLSRAAHKHPGAKGDP